MASIKKSDSSPKVASFTIRSQIPPSSYSKNGLTRIGTWCDKWLKPVNQEKSKFLYFIRKTNLQLFIHTLSGVVIGTASFYKYVGVHLVQSPSWIQHVDVVTSWSITHPRILEMHSEISTLSPEKSGLHKICTSKARIWNIIWHPSQVNLTDNLEANSHPAARPIISTYYYDVSVKTTWTTPRTSVIIWPQTKLSNVPKHLPKKRRSIWHTSLTTR